MIRYRIYSHYNLQATLSKLNRRQATNKQKISKVLTTPPNVSSHFLYSNTPTHMCSGSFSRLVPLGILILGSRVLVYPSARACASFYNHLPTKPEQRRHRWSLKFEYTSLQLPPHREIHRDFDSFKHRDYGTSANPRLQNGLTLHFGIWKHSAA